ncbi:MAG: DUF3575 domain-containing protein [Rikenellaceae bacterium]
MNHKHLLKVLIVIIFSLSLSNNLFAQGFALKTNLLCDASETISLGAELSLAEKSSLSVMASYNPWEYSDNAKRKYFLIQPEYRKWLRGVYDGFFVGAQLNYASFNVGGKLPWWIKSFDTFENNRYQGDLLGIGTTSGYQWILSPRFNIEFAVSVGYAHIKYYKYEREAGTPIIEQGIHNYWGISQVGITLVYYIK